MVGRVHLQVFPGKSKYLESDSKFQQDSYDRSRPKGPCVAVAICTYTWTTEILRRKRGCMATLQVRERVRGLERAQEREPTPSWTGFYFFSGHITSGWSSFTMHRFTVGDYLSQTTKDRTLLITSKRRMLQLKGESG